MIHTRLTPKPAGPAAAAKRRAGQRRGTAGAEDVELADGRRHWRHRRTGFEQRAAAKIHRHLIDAESVGDRARHVRDHTAQNCAAIDESLRRGRAQSRREVVRRKYRRRTAFRDKRSTGLYELVQHAQSVFTQSTTRVGRGIRIAERRIFRRALIRNGLTGRRYSLPHGTTMRPHDHVKLCAQGAHFTDRILAKVVVRNLVVVERGAHPAFVLRVIPAVHVSDAGNVEVVRLDGRRNIGGPRRQPEFLEHGLELRLVGLRDNERTGGELLSGRFERRFRRRDLSGGETIAECHHVVVARVRDNYGGARSGNAAGRSHVTLHQRH